MKTCKDCVRIERCKEFYEACGMIINLEESVACKLFKDNSRLIELPCSIGDKVYTVIYQQVYEAELICIRPFVFKDYVEFRGNVVITFEDPFYHDGRPLEQELFIVFGKDTFLTKEEAQKKLEEMTNEKE